jgi:hypothetical protein
MWCATLKVGDWNGSSGSWTVPLENISRDGVDAAVVYVQDGNREKPGADAGRAYTRCAEFCIPAHSASPESMAIHRGSDIPPRASGPRFRGHANARARKRASPKRKRTNFRWPSIGINSPANRPDPDGPGGLGAEESGTERTGSTQDYLSQASGAGDWRKWGSNMIPLTFP